MCYNFHIANLLHCMILRINYKTVIQLNLLTNKYNSKKYKNRIVK